MPPVEPQNGNIMAIPEKVGELRGLLDSVIRRLTEVCTKLEATNERMNQSERQLEVHITYHRLAEEQAKEHAAKEDKQKDSKNDYRGRAYLVVFGASVALLFNWLSQFLP